MSHPRYLEAPITADLVEKMVFVAGPRQVGKTTVALRLLDSAGPGVHLDWDHREDRKEIRRARWPGGTPLVALDEIHKWTSYTKGSAACRRIGSWPPSSSGRDSHGVPPTTDQALEPTSAACGGRPERCSKSSS